MAEASGRAFAATWINEQGEVVGTTFGGTMCLFPIKPWRIRFSGDGFEGVIRCRECPGCVELDRRRLADRLKAKYATGGSAAGAGTGTVKKQRSAASAHGTAHLFVVRIWAPLEQHAALSHKLHRRRGLELEPGMWRLGASSFALLARASLPPRTTLRKLGLRFRIEPLRLSRGRRAWRVLTAGLTVAREIYGEQRNRWYARGLPPAERQKWELRKIGKYQSYSNYTSPRAWSRGKLVLVPPDVWLMRRTDRLALRRQLLRAPDPEAVERITRMVADASRIVGSASHVSAAPKAPLSREQHKAGFQQIREMLEARTTAAPLSLTNPRTPGERGYVSSEHNQGELMPQELARARRKEWEEARKRKAIKDSMKIIERMRRKSQGGGDHDA